MNGVIRETPLKQPPEADAGYFDPVIIRLDDIAAQMAKINLERDPVLRDRFERIRTHIENASSNGFLGVFHIGSTAVPDLAAKPTVDVLAVFVGYESARETADRLASEGFAIRKDESEWIQLIRDDGRDDVFIHFRPRESDVWRNQLVFREYLRENPQARREYEQVKRAAAEHYPNDPEEYTAAKDDIVRTLERRAYEAGYDERIPDLGT